MEFDAADESVSPYKFLTIQTRANDIDDPILIKYDETQATDADIGLTGEHTVNYKVSFKEYTTN